MKDTRFGIFFFLYNTFGKYEISRKGFSQLISKSLYPTHLTTVVL